MVLITIVTQRATPDTMVTPPEADQVNGFNSLNLFLQHDFFLHDMIARN